MKIKTKGGTAMKANDLMIGDWVEFRPHNEKPFYAQVEALNNDETYNKDGYFADKLVQPIPLTPEILEKNGFVNNDGDFRFFKADEESYYFGFESVHYYFETHFCNVTKEFSQGGMQNQSKGIFTYVHQLQHALRLCGIDKEITL